MKTLLLVLLVSGCATLQQRVAPPVLAALALETDLADVIVHVDQMQQEHATSKAENLKWRAERDKMRAALHAFHEALLAIVDTLQLKGPNP